METPSPNSYRPLDRLLPKTAERLQGLVEGGIFSATGAQLIVHAGGERHHGSVGVTASGAPMSDAQVFRMGCALKPLTGLAVATLVAAGELDLEAPVSSVVPLFSGGGKEGVKVVHLLTHTSGVVERPGSATDGFPRQILRAAYKSRLRTGWLPGQHAAYSVWGAWQVLGEVVQNVAGMDFPAFLRQHVLGPHDEIWVGMSEEEYENVAPRIEPLGSPWDWASPVVPLTIQRSPFLCTQVLPGSGGYATLPALVAFFERLLRADDEAVSLVTAQHRAPMHDSGDGTVGAYGLGVRIGLGDYGVSSHCSASSFGHSGLYRSILVAADPQSDLVIGLLFGEIHADDPASAHRARVVIDSVYEELDAA